MRTILFSALLLFSCFAEGKEIKLWGIDISDTHPEISGNCKVIDLNDQTIFEHVKVTANAYTFANDKPNYTCWYGEESACFSKVTEYLTSIFGKPLEVYTHDKGNTFTVKPAFFNIWKFDSGNQHYLLLLFGSGEGMTLDVNLYSSEARSAASILNFLRCFHFSIKPELQRALEK